MHAPMLKELGYDLSPNPKYGEPDELVKKNLKLLEENPDKYQVETELFSEGKVVKGPQVGAHIMEQHRKESQMGIKNPDDLDETWSPRDNYFGPKTLNNRLKAPRRAQFRRPAKSDNFFLK